MLRKIRNRVRYWCTGELYSVVTWDGSNVGIRGVFTDKEYAYELAARLRENTNIRAVVKKTQVSHGI